MNQKEIEMAEVLFYAVEGGRMALRQGEERELFGFDETGRAREWLEGREYPEALGSSSIDHPEEYGATGDQIDKWLEAVFERDPMLEVGPLPNGHMLYLRQDEVGHSYWSDEVGGGVCVWKTALVDERTVLAAIVAEYARKAAERRNHVPEEPKT